MPLTSLFVAPGPQEAVAVDPGGTFDLVAQSDPNDPGGGPFLWDAAPTTVYTFAEPARAALGPLACQDVTGGLLASPAPALVRTVTVPAPATDAGGASLADTLALATVTGLVDGVAYQFLQYVLFGPLSGSPDDDALDPLDDLETWTPAAPNSFAASAITGVGPGPTYARQLRWDRAKFGGDLILTPQGYAPLAVRAKAIPLRPDAAALILEGAGLNAAFGDLRSLEASPADLPALPSPGSAATWEGLAFTVLSCAAAQQLAGTPHTQRITLYRSPADPSVTAQGPGMASPGKRKTYAPPAATF